MPNKVPGVSEEELKKLLDRGYTHALILARLQFAEANQLLTHYLLPMVGQDRVHPDMRPTQASGRWSTTNPPMPNLPADKKYGPEGIRDVVGPDPGYRWDKYDYDSIEAVLVAYDCQDLLDIEAFEQGYDIHTLTACKMNDWPLPPFEPVKGNLYGPVGQEWCLEIGQLIHQEDCKLVGHAGCHIIPWADDHRWRRLAKNCRYSLIYELVRSNGAAMRRYAYEMKMDPIKLQKIGAQYLASKPGFVAWKQNLQVQYSLEGISRTLVLGRRRLLAGISDDRAKTGLNHRIQGSVADLMSMALIAIDTEWGTDVTLAYQSHDGAIHQFPGTLNPYPRLKELVEHIVPINGRLAAFRASWKTIWPKETP